MFAESCQPVQYVLMYSSITNRWNTCLPVRRPKQLNIFKYKIFRRMVQDSVVFMTYFKVNLTLANIFDNKQSNDVTY
jgi:hypothetical protein